MTSQCFAPLVFYTMTLYSLFTNINSFLKKSPNLNNKLQSDHTFHPRSAFISSSSKEQVRFHLLI